MILCDCVTTGLRKGHTLMTDLLDLLLRASTATATG
jgi:hypothetical protein